MEEAAKISRSKRKGWHGYLGRLQDRQRQDDIALIDDQGSLTYAELLHQLECFEFDGKQIENIEAHRNRHAVIRLLAAWKSGNSALLLSPDNEEKKRQLGSLSTADVSPLNQRDTSEQMLVLATSGSTGQPKWISHNLDSFLSGYLTVSKAYCTYGAISIDHIGGLDDLLSCLAAGGTFVMTESSAQNAIAECIERNRVAMIASTPSWLKWLKLAISDDKKFDAIELISFGGEPLDDLTLDLTRDFMPNAKVIQKYGSTELGVLRSRCNPEDPRELAFDPAVRYQICDGMLEVWNSDGKKYSGAVVQSEESWIKTGDKVEQRGDWVRIIGRREDEIVSGGEVVSVSRVRSVVVRSDYVLDCHVYSESNLLLGSTIGIDLVVSPGVDQDIAVADVRNHCNSELPRSHQPSRLKVVSQLQHSPRFKRQSG